MVSGEEGGGRETKVEEGMGDKWGWTKIKSNKKKKNYYNVLLISLSAVDDKLIAPN